jgi:pimeloyl-ACP methyl ester carboxylesterase
MASARDRRIWIGLGAAGALGASGALAQRRHLRRIASDPEQAVLAEPPTGEPIGIRSPDGTQLHAETFGPSDGQTFVLAHGWTEMLAYWVYVIRTLSERGFRVVAYDLRGHGQSEPAPDGDYSLRRFGDDLQAVLEATVPSGQRAIVVGHSLGAMSIAAWAEHHEVERLVSGAALLNTGVGDLLAENLLVPVPAIAQLLNKVLPPSVTLGARAAVPKFSTPLSSAITHYFAFGPEASPAQVAFYERMLVACPPDVRGDVGIAMSEMDLYDALPRLTVPTLVMAGEKDRLTPPSHATRIAEALPNLQRQVVLPRTGHMGPLERPREVGDALIDLAAVATGAPAASLSA